MKPAFDDLLDSIYALNVNQSLKDNLINKVKVAKQTRLLSKCTLELVDFNNYPPNKLEVGDIISTMPNGLVHPSMIIKIVGNKVYAVPFTSNIDFLGNITETNNRFITGYLTNSIQTLSYDHAINHWKGVITPKTEVNRLIREFKQFYKTLLNLK